MEIKNVLVIGLGGIGSYLVRNLGKAQKYNQLKDVLVTVCDFDSVELKNVRYQNYIKDDVLENKVKVIAKRYHLSPLNKKIVSKDDLEGFDLIVLCVDNAKTRKMVFNALEGTDKVWIDARSKGRIVSVFVKSKRNTAKEMERMTIDDPTDGSCQNSYELERDIVQYGNVISASMTLQLLLNILRNEKLLKDRYILRI